jgi:hypothetical protein
MGRNCKKDRHFPLDHSQNRVNEWKTRQVNNVGPEKVRKCRSEREVFDGQRTEEDGRSGVGVTQPCGGDKKSKNV